jgi:hypothetical protein
MCFAVAAHASAAAGHRLVFSAAAASASRSSCLTTCASCRSGSVSRSPSNASAKEEAWFPARAASRARWTTPRQRVSAAVALARVARDAVAPPHDPHRKSAAESPFPETADSI